MIFGPLVIAVATFALVTPILVNAHRWWPRRFVAAVFVAAALQIMSLYMSGGIGTPGFLIVALLAPVIDDPSWATPLVLWLVIDWSLWFVAIWGADSLLSNVRARSPKKLSWPLARASVCALTPSLFVFTGYSNWHRDAFSLWRPWFLLPACVLGLFLLFLAITLAIYGAAMRFWPASWLKKADPDEAKFTTLNLP